MDDSKKTDDDLRVESGIDEQNSKTSLRVTDSGAPSPELKPTSTARVVEAALSEAGKHRDNSVKSVKPSWRNRWTNPFNRLPQVYLVDYTAFLLLSGSILVLTNYFWRGIIDAFGKQSGQSLFGAQFSYNSAVEAVAATLVLIPFLLWFLRRVSFVETNTPAVKNHRIRKWLLGVFLILVITSAIMAAVSLMQSIFGTIANLGLSTEDKNPQLVKSVLKDLFVFGIFTVTAIIYARDFHYHETHDHHQLANHKRLLNFFLAIIATGVLIGYVSFPLMKQRASFIDSVITKDLQSIADKIYSTAPTRYSKTLTLKDLQLNDQVKQRIEKYNYTLEHKKQSAYEYYYELCADFKTDTKTDADKQKPAIPELLNSGISSDRATNTSSSYRQNEDDFSLHSKGRSCFKLYDGQPGYDDYTRPTSGNNPEVIVN